MSARNAIDDLTDPIKLAKVLWPNLRFYRKQRQIIYSVRYNDETIVPAGNMLGKDFVAGFCALDFFLTRNPVRVVSTSADYSQLQSVLWGEIRRFIQNAKYPLTSDKGGPLLVNHLHIRKVLDPKTNAVCPLSYLIGRVAAKGEGLLGHHISETGDGIPRTFFLGDEGSGLDDESIDRATTWARRILLIGNPYPCANYFKRAVKGDGTPDGDKGGDLPRPPRQHEYSRNRSVLVGNGTYDTDHAEGGYYRKVIKIRAQDSPNVRYAEEEMRRGLQPSGKVIIRGVLPFRDYEKRRAIWDKIRQCVSLDAEFYEGFELLLFPPDWLDKAERLYGEHQMMFTSNKANGLRRRKAKCIGIDPGEGGAETAMAVGDEYGIMEVVARKTADTDQIPRDALALMIKHKVPAEMVFMDSGGGGKQHADRLRAKGYDVKTVHFGSPASLDPMRRRANYTEKLDEREDRSAYFNKRSEMYGLLSELMDPSRPNGLGELNVGDPKYGGFSLIPNFELRRQLAPIPKVYDEEGKLRLPPKNNKPNSDGSPKKSTTKSLTDILGCSPDRADAVALCVYGLVNGKRSIRAGAMEFEDSLGL